MITDPLQWLCVGVHARKERACEDELRRTGCETFFPRTVERRAWSDRVKQVERVLFPGYGFVRVAREAYASAMVLRCRHVLTIVGRGAGRPAPEIPADVIGSLRLAVNAEREHAVKAHLVVGTQVEVARGPMMGARGTVVDGKNGVFDALYVNVELLGQTVRCELTADDLVVAITDSPLRLRA